MHIEFPDIVFEDVLDYSINIIPIRHRGLKIWAFECEKVGQTENGVKT